MAEDQDISPTLIESGEQIGESQERDSIDTALAEVAEITKFTESRAKKLRDEKGKFKAKPNPEFTLAHFWLEIMEIAIGILIAQVLWEGGVWLIK